MPHGDCNTPYFSSVAMDPFNIKHPIDEELDARLIEAIGTADHDYNKYHLTLITNPQITL